MKRFLTVAAVLIAMTGQLSAQTSFILTEVTNSPLDAVDLIIQTPKAAFVFRTHSGFGQILTIGGVIFIDEASEPTCKVIPATVYGWMIQKNDKKAAFSKVFNFQGRQTSIVICMAEYQPTHLTITIDDNSLVYKMGDSAPQNWKKFVNLLPSEEQVDLRLLFQSLK